jgi:curved DNA-binding protein CbpA
VTLKTYYDLLGIESTASPEDVKRAFRHQIARYHPDKVQHLGAEFQQMAAVRAAELTEAYRILSDLGRRAEYDQVCEAAGGQQPGAGASPPDPAPLSEDRPPPQPAPEPAPASEGEPFSHERASRDEFVRRATTNRLRQALDALKDDAYEEQAVGGFDIAFVPQRKLFGRNRNPRLLGRVVSNIDAEAIAKAWTQAARWSASPNDEVRVLLIGAAMMSRRELEGAITAQRRKAGPGGKVTLIPIDARDWSAHIPTDAPALAKKLLAHLRGDA